MEALAAIGLASAIVQFIDFSSKLIAGANEVYSSATGATAAAADSEVALDNLKDLTRRLKVPTTSSPLSAEDENLIALQQGCQKLSSELQEILQSIKPKKKGSKIASLKASWRAQRQEGKIASLEKRLGTYRIDILGQLLRMMNDDVSDTYHSLQKSMETQDRYAKETREEIRQTRANIIDALKKELQAANPSITTTATLESMHQSLLKLTDAVRTVPREDRILQKLWFPEILSRERTVETAHNRTFRWLLYTREKAHNDSGPESYNDPSSESYDGSGPGIEAHSEPESIDSGRKHAAEKLATSRGTPDTISWQEEALKRDQSRENFLAWLEQGKGVFFISGKAGSGKSTLMKFIAHETKTRQELEGWAQADGKALVFARFFFWNSATSLQKSLEGLYRSILWEILRQCPYMIPKVFSWSWSSNADANDLMSEHPFELTELQNALACLFDSPELLARHKICLLIDGLDEYEGDYWKLANMLDSWVNKSIDVKLCLSSRPHREFLQKFGSVSRNHVRLQDLTREDMYRVVQSEFREREELVAIEQQSDYRNHHFINAIVEKADGVFLWVRLVTTSLLKAIGDNYSITQLYRILESAPRGLDGMFRQMMDSIDGSDQKRTSQMFLTMINDFQSEPVARWVYSQGVLDDLFDHPESQSSLLSGDADKVMDWEECDNLYHTVGTRITARCKGLVEISHTVPDRVETPFCCKIEFVHRTMSDFFSNPDIQEELQKRAGVFSPHHALIQALLGIVKFIDLRRAAFCPKDNLQPSLRRSRSSDSTASEFRDIVQSFFKISYLAERAGLPYFLPEFKSLISMLEKRAESGPEMKLNLWSLHMLFGDGIGLGRSLNIPVGPRKVQWAVFELGLGQTYNTNIVWELISSDPNLTIPRPQNDFNFALAGALRQLMRDPGEVPSMRSWRDAQAGVDPNIECPGTSSLAIQGSRRISKSLASPPWTTWTSLLLALTRFMQGAFHRRHFSSVVLYVMEVFLNLGADPSVCFIGYEIVGGLDRGYNAKGPFYLNLEGMMRLWQMTPAPSMTKACASRSQERGWLSPSRVFTKLMNLGALPQTMPSVAPEDVNVDEFVTLKVVSREGLGSISLEDWSSIIRLFCRAKDREDLLLVRFNV